MADFAIRAIWRNISGIAVLLLFMFFLAKAGHFEASRWALGALVMLTILSGLQGRHKMKTIARVINDNLAGQDMSGDNQWLRVSNELPNITRQEFRIAKQWLNEQTMAF